MSRPDAQAGDTQASAAQARTGTDRLQPVKAENPAEGTTVLQSPKVPNSWLGNHRRALSMDSSLRNADTTSEQERLDSVMRMSMVQTRGRNHSPISVHSATAASSGLSRADPIFPSFMTFQPQTFTDTVPDAILPDSNTSSGGNSQTPLLERLSLMHEKL